MPDTYINQVMNNFCQQVLKGSFNDVKDISESDPSDFDINYVVPGNFKAIQGLTALQIALCHQKYDIAKYLIDQCHADVNAQGADGVTALCVAVDSLNEEWVDRLLNLGAKTTIEARPFPQPFERIEYLFGEEWVNSLLSLGAKTTIKAHAFREPLERLEYIFDCGPQYYNKETLFSICRKLIEKGADVSKIKKISFLYTVFSSTLTHQSEEPYFNTLDHEETEAWTEPEKDINNTLLGDNRISGTVNFNNLIDTMASVEPWVRAVSSIGILTGITGLFWFFLGAVDNSHRSP